MTHLPSLQPVVDAALDEHLHNARSYLSLLPRDMYHALLTERYCYSHCCHCDKPCAPAAAYPTYIRYTMLGSDMPTDAVSFARLTATPGRYCTLVQCLAAGGAAHARREIYAIHADTMGYQVKRRRACAAAMRRRRGLGVESASRWHAGPLDKSARATEHPVEMLSKPAVRPHTGG